VGDAPGGTGGQAIVVKQERYCGIGSILIAIVCFPIGLLVCCCPVDQRTRVATKYN
jgi:hypothetical protein